MDDGDKVFAAEDGEPLAGDPKSPINSADSTAKFSSNELSESTEEIENSIIKTERLDPILNNKLNGDCAMECSVPPHSLIPTSSSHNSSVGKITSEIDISFNEKTTIDQSDGNDRSGVLKNNTEEVISVGSKEINNSKNLEQVNYEHLLQNIEDRTLEDENLESEKYILSTNFNEFSSTLDEKNSESIETITSISFKHESKSMPKPKKSLSDSASSGSSKSNENFKPPPRYDLKSKARSTDCAMLENNQRQNNDTINKITTDKSSRNNKKKSEEKHLNLNEDEFKEIEKFPIQYKGFKKKSNNICEKHRLNLRWNPFNPSCKTDRKPNKCVPSRLPVGDEIDCSSLQQSEYAQYLGLQPILKFRCSNCGSSAFQSMVALNTHQIECTKSGKGKLDKSQSNLVNSITEPKSTNIKLTRKVFVCSACGYYYEHWNLFLHMREVHRRYICLYCLGMFSVAEKLSEHLIQKHKITYQNFSSLDNFLKQSYQTFFLLCLTCDKVFSEMDDFYGHVCTASRKSIDSIDSIVRSEAVVSQDFNNTSSETSSGGNKLSSKRVKEIKKITGGTRLAQTKKDEIMNVSTSQKLEETESLDVKDDLTKPNDNIVSKHPEIVNICLNENIESDNTHNQPEIESNEEDIKLTESQTSAKCLTSIDKFKQMKKTRPPSKKNSGKRKKPKEKEDENESSAFKLKKISEDGLFENQSALEGDSNVLPATDIGNDTEMKEHVGNTEELDQSPTQSAVSENTENVTHPCIEQITMSGENKSPLVKKEEPQEYLNEVPSSTSLSETTVEIKNKLQASLLKFKLPDVESDVESDDSQKLSLIVDETATSDTENKSLPKERGNCQIDNEIVAAQNTFTPEGEDNNIQTPFDLIGQDITLASGDVAVMALTLDDKIENIPIQTVLKECVRTSCMSCNYCRHAVKIAVNGKQLALHILSEHRYMPIKNETPSDVINKLKSSLTILQTMFFNTETYDSSEPSIHVPYDQDSSFDCFQCNYVTSSHRDLFAHKRKSHTKSLLLCIMCKSNFYSYSELLCHLCPGSYNAEIQFHNVDINFRCCFCRLDTIPSAFRLMVHLRKTHHTCDICLENDVDQQKLSTHMWKHKLNHLCYRCGIAYASKPDITKHLFWKHGHESVLCKKCLQKKWPHVYHFCIPPTSFICEECNTSFSKAVALKVHKRIHGNDFPYVCTECSKKFVSKKLLGRHEERHFAIKNNELAKPEISQEHQKEEIVNVADTTDENKKSTLVELSDSKEVEFKDKSHKKHKKDKDKKDKQVVDVYDLPPLNLSSESDSSDEDNTLNGNCATMINLPTAEDRSAQTASESKTPENNDNLLLKKESENHSKIGDVSTESKVIPPKISQSYEVNTTTTNTDSYVLNEDNNKLGEGDNGTETKEDHQDRMDVLNSTKTVWGSRDESEALEGIPSNDNAISNKEVEDIWKNFYNTNPQNSNLPYPLCAIKSEIALGIIMGDHDYCHQPPEPTPFSDDVPSTSGLTEPLINDKLEEVLAPTQEKVSDILPSKDSINASPLNSSKKKPKSPKKKNTKGENENNSSSSSDSSSESSSSSCSCGPNCSCSSSSSNSSTSSSSDSESSAGEEGVKQERKRKKRERHNKVKSEQESELPKTQVEKQGETPLPAEPVDPPIRESELETDETTTDEEFYDQQPQRIANQLLAEKRNQLMLLASAANANNGNASPLPVVDVLQSEIISPPKQKIRNKRKRKVNAKGKPSSEKTMANSHPYPQYPKENEQPIKQVPLYHGNALPVTDPKVASFMVQAPVSNETPGSGSETEKSRSSKRRRIPNKFYGYSSGEEDEKPAPSPKWKKQETISQPLRVQPTHPSTPRIQLTVPKQMLRKPYKHQKPVQKPRHSSSDSTDSGSEPENQRATHVPVIAQEMPSSAASQKNDKDVYCYCRCPYDEVSEMIACDDENCEIEWFHFECVGILVPPRGQWFCPGCRKARGLPT